MVVNNLLILFHIHSIILTQNIQPNLDSFHPISLPTPDQDLGIKEHDVVPVALEVEHIETMFPRKPKRLFLQRIRPRNSVDPRIKQVNNRDSNLNHNFNLSHLPTTLKSTKLHKVNSLLHPKLLLGVINLNHNTINVLRDILPLNTHNLLDILNLNKAISLVQHMTLKCTVRCLHLLLLIQLLCQHLVLHSSRLLMDIWALLWAMAQQLCIILIICPHLILINKGNMPALGAHPTIKHTMLHTMLILFQPAM